MQTGRTTLEDYELPSFYQTDQLGFNSVNTNCRLLHFLEGKENLAGFWHAQN